ncbi:hypothetical protein Ciccas_008219 [Cichlidogyrus casuarinus]|uniref:Uncharacterized protein n=1 Tax=Cichlidogyrus casuarinus TaxID=1844966 RepID=A0ABD2Q0K0_9PLAT
MQKTLETWFTDVIRNKWQGGIERHSYIFERSLVPGLNVCQLKEYKIQIGQYMNPAKSCQLLFSEEQVFLPRKNTFRIGFKSNFFEDVPLLDC